MKKIFTLENALLFLPVLITCVLSFATKYIDYPIDNSQDILMEGISTIQLPF
ncbi:MAG: hypothetical protein PHE21_03960 [Candidatus Dojkabacteria bacterium]|nr:hypothetical protein [Candidatus Dojkabacteria bacterium]